MKNTIPTLALEVWRDVPGYVGYYQASNHGRVRSLDRSVVTKQKRKDGSPVYRTLTGKVMPGTPVPRGGHLRTSLGRDGVQWNTSIHQVVALTFLGPCPDGKEIAHGDGNPTNNRPENLRYATREENEADKLLHGTDSRGIKHVSSKLTEAQVLQIRYTYRQGGTTQKALGAEYGVSGRNISGIVRGKQWKHLPLNPSLTELSL